MLIFTKYVCMDIHDRNSILRIDFSFVMGTLGNVFVYPCVFEGAGAQHGAEQQQLPEAAGCREEEDNQCPGGDQDSAGRAGTTDQ